MVVGWSTSRFGATDHWLLPEDSSTGKIAAPVSIFVHVSIQFRPSNLSIYRFVVNEYMIYINDSMIADNPHQHW